MTALSATALWCAVMGLLYIALYCLLAAITRADAAYALFSVVFAGCAYLVVHRVVREGAR